MKKTIAILDDRLSMRGSCVPFEQHIEESAYELGPHRFTLPQGIDLALTLTNAGQGIFASGLLRAKVSGVCDRCLEPCSFDLSAEVDEYFLFEEPENTSTLSEDDKLEYGLVSSDNSIDLTDCLQEALLNETPYIVLCSPDCKGLCAGCGANLNTAACACENGDTSESDAFPLSHNAQELLKLRELKLKLDGSQSSSKSS